MWFDCCRPRRTTDRNRHNIALLTRRWLEHDAEKHAPDAIRGGHQFFRKPFPRVRPEGSCSNNSLKRMPIRRKGITLSQGDLFSFDVQFYTDAHRPLRLS